MGRRVKGRSAADQEKIDFFNSVMTNWKDQDIKLAFSDYLLDHGDPNYEAWLWIGSWNKYPDEFTNSSIRWWAYDRRIWSISNPYEGWHPNLWKEEPFILPTKVYEVLDRKWWMDGNRQTCFIELVKAFYKAKEEGWTPEYPTTIS